MDAVRLARWLVLFVCLAMVATTGWLIVGAHRDEIARATLANTNLARAVAEQVESSVSEADNIVAGIGFELERSDITPLTLQRLQPVLVNHIAAVPQLGGLFVYDATGRWIASSDPVWDATFTDADSAYFAHHRMNASARPLVGMPIRSRSSGQWVMPVSRRLTDADGNFAGVVLGTLSIQHLRSLLDRFDVGSDGAIALSLGDRLLVRKPSRSGDVDKPMGNQMRELLTRQRAGHIDARSPIDGVRRLISFEHTRNFPIVVTVATSRQEVLGQWRRAAYAQGAGVIFLCLLLAVAVQVVQRAIRQRARAERGVREMQSALADANKELARQAQHDALTGLPNRRYFDARLARAFRRAQRERQPVAIVMVDVDEFKKYNDHYGHVGGDDCLRRVASALRSAVARPDDMLARYGGEELVFLLPGTDAAGAAKVAEVARQAVLAARIAHAGAAAGLVSVSLGVASWVPAAPDTSEALLKAADQALYDAKHGGRNRVVVAHA